MPPLAFTIEHETSQDAGPIEALHALAFGPGRFARTGFLLREGAMAKPDLAATAWDTERLVGSVRFAALTLKAAPGAVPVLLLGPLAVVPERQGNGLGLSLIREGLVRAQATGHDLVLLIGDPAYYGKAGFLPVPPGSVSSCLPLDEGRLLWLSLSGTIQDCPCGELQP